MYAIVEIAGKQYKVQENDKLFVPHLADAKVDDTIEFDRVLLVADGDDVRVGTPLVAAASVSATVLEHVKADKILIFRKIRRKRFKVKKGHRQRYTQVEVGAVSLNGEKPKSASKKKSADTEAKAADSGKAEAKQAEAKSTAKETGKTEAKQAETKEATTPDTNKGGAAQAEESAETAETKATGKSAENDVRPESDAGPKPARSADESADSGDAEDEEKS